MQVDFSRNVHCLLGLPFDAVDIDEASARVRSAAAGGASCFLSTPNLNFLVASRRDAVFRASVVLSDLCIMDGAPLVWLARALGVPIRKRVAGSTLFETLRQDGKPLSVFFFGGPPGVAAQACARLNSGGAGSAGDAGADGRGAMRCAGYCFPGYGSIDEMSSGEILDQINASGADFLVVALGAGKGQEWIVRNRGRLAPPVISHLGAVVNIVAGTVIQAPRWMQECGLEWLWRIKEEPTLWKRYWHDGTHLLRLVATHVIPHAWIRRRHAPDAAALARAAVQLAQEEAVLVVRLQGAWNGGNLTPLRESLATAIARARDIRIDLTAVSHVDSAFLGLLMLLHGYQNARGACLCIDGLQPLVRRVFKLSCADYMLRETATRASCARAYAA